MSQKPADILLLTDKKDRENENEGHKKTVGTVADRGLNDVSMCMR